MLVKHGRLTPGYSKFFTTSIILCCFLTGAVLFRYISIDHEDLTSSYDQLPTIYILTATYSRHVQRAELTRLCNTLMNVRKVHWIVVEDSTVKTDLVTKLLVGCGISYTHLNVATPDDKRPRKDEPFWRRPKGILQRNEGLQWIRDKKRSGVNNGVLYIADDDNTYDIRIFEEMRYTVDVSTWPVAFAGELPWEGCVTSAADRSRIVSMWTAFRPDRAFPLDMAGFAVNIKLILRHPTARFDYDRPLGMQESLFLQQLGLKNWTELEPKADGCQKILVWHTRTAEPLLASWLRMEAQGVIAPVIADHV